MAASGVDLDWLLSKIDKRDIYLRLHRLAFIDLYKSQKQSPNPYSKALSSTLEHIAYMIIKQTYPDEQDQGEIVDNFKNLIEKLKELQKMLAEAILDDKAFVFESYYTGPLPDKAQLEESKEFLFVLEHLLTERTDPKELPFLQNAIAYGAQLNYLSVYRAVLDIADEIAAGDVLSLTPAQRLEWIKENYTADRIVEIQQFPKILLMYADALIDLIDLAEDASLQELEECRILLKKNGSKSIFFKARNGLSSRYGFIGGR